MSTTKKIIVGILTVVPIFIIPLYLLSFFSFIKQAQHISPSGQFSSPEENMKMLIPMAIYLGVALVISISMLIFYIVDILKNPKFQGPGNNKLIWILIVLFTGIIGKIVYYIMEIIPRKELPPLPENNEMI
jgi:hypothetical protein